MEPLKYSSCIRFLKPHVGLRFLDRAIGRNLTDVRPVASGQCLLRSIKFVIAYCAGGVRTIRAEVAAGSDMASCRFGVRVRVRAVGLGRSKREPNRTVYTKH